MAQAMYGLLKRRFIYYHPINVALLSQIWSYSVGIYVSAGFTLSTALWITFFTGVVNFIASLCGPMIMMWFNRRTLMMFSCISAATMMLCLSIALSLKVGNLQTYHTKMLFNIFSLSLAPLKERGIRLHCSNITIYTMHELRIIIAALLHCFRLVLLYTLCFTWSSIQFYQRSSWVHLGLLPRPWAA